MRSCNASCGSSPRARGTLRPSRLSFFALRIIPASAGNTGSLSLRSTTKPDHPRERGEHINAISLPTPFDGSSPRARGTPWRPDADHRQRRIIPASAGNTYRGRRSRVNSTDHPRERGEHPNRVTSPDSADGSSPRARGTPNGAHNQPFRRRIIPASAGNTDLRKTNEANVPDHPRERGEHTANSPAIATESGSSPRARGTPCVHSFRSCTMRIIPASAGNTDAPRKLAAPRADHPRERGEHDTVTDVSTLASGSSPRARGTLVTTGKLSFSDRIIPASAGNTPRRLSYRSPWTDHPRERGEHIQTTATAIASCGSSPRARGTRW